MNHHTRRAAAVIGTLATAASVVSIAPAQAEEVAGSRITVRSSEYDVSSGEQFVLRGRLMSEGDPVSDATVRVKTYRNGAWVRLEGAVVSTNDEGRYRVRVILSMKGERKLRVVGNPLGDDIKTARKGLVVTVR
ncbi:MAG TPA: hypothetical protein VFZ64_05815 [Nocardioidaceae bacterium]